MHHLETKFDGVLGSQDELRDEVDKLRGAYQTVAAELSNVQRTLLQQQSVIRFLFERLTGGQLPESTPTNQNTVRRLTIPRSRRSKS